MISNYNLLNNIQNVIIDSQDFEEVVQWKQNIKENNHLTCVHLNIKSIRKYWDTFLLAVEPVLDQIDVMVLTDVNAKDEEVSVYKLEGFMQIRKCRLKGLCGGIVVYYKEKFKIEQIMYSFDQAENINFKLFDSTKKLLYIILAVYRPPNNDIPSFITDLQWWLENATQKSDSVLMVGDINICLAKKTSHATSYKNLLASQGLLPLIKSFTREEMLLGKPTFSCIDHINIRLRHKCEISSAVISEKIADHYFVTVQIYKNEIRPTERRSLKQVRYVKIRNEQKIQEKISQFNWSEIEHYQEPEQIYQKIVDIFQDIYEKHSSLKPRTKKDDLFPWVNYEIKVHIAEKKNLYQRWRKNKSNLILYETYKTKRNEVTNMIKKQRRIFIFKKLRDAKGDVKKTWRVLNFILDKKEREPNEAILSKNFETHDFVQLANTFNNNFKTQIKKLKEDNTGPSFSLDFCDHELQNTVTSLHIKPPSIIEISKIIDNLRITGPGSDGILPADVKKNSLVLRRIITYLIRRIIETERIPDEMKISCITPLYKKGDVKSHGNYRPVGSLCFIEKILEKYIETRTKKYLTENEIIAPFQYGFQPNKSTTTLLENFSKILNHALDRRKYIIILFLDLTRAFETLDHENLLNKFKSIGFRSQLFRNYLFNRTQVTKVGKTNSEKVVIEDGLVTGGITSPGWFNIYTYDIKYLNLKSHLLMFADDSCIVSIHTNLEKAVENAQEDFMKIQKYFYNNDIYINESKTEAIAMGTARGMANIEQHRVKCHSRSCLYTESYKSGCPCENIKYSENCRYLGVNIDMSFKMKTHVEIMCKKLRIINYQFRKGNTCILSKKTKALLYHALVESIIRYGVTLYTYSPQYVLDPLLSVQKKILHYLFGENTQAYLQPHNLAKLAILLSNFKNQEYRRKKETKYNIRQQNFQSSIAYTKYGERLVSFIMPQLLNKYCNDYINEEKIYIVKEKFKEQLLKEQYEII